mmetsp:Transcript_8328/g.12728  ORF Transcript_8328/g.12728 Transcript_8328/m.12728 type:complete len:140 (+) Transcript_8328:607-1026(+)
MIVPHSFFLKYLKDEPDASAKNVNFYRRYFRWHCMQFTDQNKAILWCPNERCDRVVVKSEFDPVSTIQCECRLSLCLMCNHEDHSPGTCFISDQWLEKEKNESPNMAWVKLNTKACPKCKVSIEKNQGCNHMTCWKCQH